MIFENEKICPICKKRFIVQPLHIYKDKRKSKSKGTFVCSYTCMLESERMKPQRKNKTKGVMI